MFPNNWSTLGWLTLQDWSLGTDGEERTLGVLQVVGAMRLETPDDQEDIIPSNLTEGHMLGGLFWGEADDKRDGMDTWWLTPPPVEYFEPGGVESDGEGETPGGSQPRPVTGGELAGPARPVTGGGASYGGVGQSGTGSGATPTAGSPSGGGTRTRPVTDGDGGGSTRASPFEGFDITGASRGPGAGSGWFALAAIGERDERLVSKSPAFPEWAGDMKLPSGWVGTILSGTKSLERAPQEEFLLPGFYGLVAPNRHPEYEMGTLVHELGADKRPAFHSRLQSMMSVEQVGMARHNALALQLGPERQRGTAGYMMLSDWGSGLLASASHYQGGPFLTADDKDQHKVGVTRDGKVINSAHLSIFTLFHGPSWDCPLFFESGPWPNPQSGPHKINVHLVNDISSSHAWGPPDSGRVGAGLGRWYADAFWYGDEDDPWERVDPPEGDPPPPPPPPPGGDPPPRRRPQTGDTPGGVVAPGGGIALEGGGTLIPTGSGGAAGGGGAGATTVGPPGFPRFPGVPDTRGTFFPAFAPNFDSLGPWPGGEAVGIPLPVDALGDAPESDVAEPFDAVAHANDVLGFDGEPEQGRDLGLGEALTGVPSPDGSAYVVGDDEVITDLIGGPTRTRPTYATSTNCIQAAGGVAFRVAATAVGSVDLRGAKVVTRGDRQASDRAPLAVVLEAYGIGDGTWDGWQGNDDGSKSDPNKRENVNGAVALLPAWAAGVSTVLAGGLGIGAAASIAAGHARAYLALPTGYSGLAFGTPSEANGNITNGNLVRALPNGGTQVKPVDGAGTECPTGYSFTKVAFIADSGARVDLNSPDGLQTMGLGGLDLGGMLIARTGGSLPPKVSVVGDIETFGNADNGGNIATSALCVKRTISSDTTVPADQTMFTRDLVIAPNTELLIELTGEVAIV